MDDHQAVESAIQAVEHNDAPGLVRALAQLAQADQAAVIEELLVAVDAAAHGTADSPVPATAFMPDPGSSGELLSAVIAGDEAAILGWARRNEPDLVTGLIGLAAALRS